MERVLAWKDATNSDQSRLPFAVLVLNP